MRGKMEIKVELLEKVTTLLFDHLREREIKTVSWPVDYYWAIPDEQLYDMTTEPDNLGVGELSHDWSILEGILNDRRGPLLYNFMELAAILKAIGQHTSEV
jgi:hypothetical protein